MNSVFPLHRPLRFGLAIVCALSLAACGGGSGTLAVTGTVTGLVKDGLVLQNNGGDDLTISPSGGQNLTFAFATLIGTDSPYNVTVKSAPSSAVCTVVNGKGNSGAFNVTSVVVNCVTNVYDLGGTITGLDSDGLVLINGSDRVAVKAGATSFTFTRATGDGPYPYGKVGDGYPYGVTVLTQPAGRTCAVTNGVGTMGAGANNSVVVTCV
jgi:hypothetical protein